jgi:hypothetical protein
MLNPNRSADTFYRILRELDSKIIYYNFSSVSNERHSARKRGDLLTRRAPGLFPYYPKLVRGV